MKMCGDKYWQEKDSRDKRRLNHLAVRDISRKLYFKAREEEKIPKEELRWLLGIKVMEAFLGYSDYKQFWVNSDLTGTLYDIPFSLDTKHAYTLSLFREVKIDLSFFLREECSNKGCKKCVNGTFWY